MPMLAVASNFGAFDSKWYWSGGGLGAPGNFSPFSGFSLPNKPNCTIEPLTILKSSSLAGGWPRNAEAGAMIRGDVCEMGGKFLAPIMSSPVLV